MIDPCFWCKVPRCPTTHNRERFEYRQDMHQLARLLLLTPPSKMGMREHRLKGFYLQFYKHYKQRKRFSKLWKLINAEADKAERRALNYFPEFSLAERLAIQRWKPRHQYKNTPYSD